MPAQSDPLRLLPRTILEALITLKEVASVQIGREKINNLAFANDIKVFSETSRGAQELNQQVEIFLDWSNLKANVSKCAFLAISGNKDDRHCPDTIIQNQRIPRIKSGDSYRYLVFLSPSTVTNAHRISTTSYQEPDTTAPNCSNLVSSLCKSSKR